MSLNLAELPLRSAERHPDLPAIRLGELTISYSQLAAQIQACANVLATHGIGRGDHVGLIMPNVPQFPVGYYGILATGATVVPMNVLFVADEVAYHLGDSDAKALIVWSGFLTEALEGAQRAGNVQVFVVRAPGFADPLPEGCVDLAAAMAAAGRTGFDPCASGPDDTAVILYTSGTTGRPKGAELTHFNLYDNARFVAERLFQREPGSLRLLGPGDVGLAALPLFHSFGQTVLQNGFLMSGATISLLPRFSATDAAKLIRAHRVTFFAGVPTMYIALLADSLATREQFESLSYAVSGGAALPVEVLHGFEQKFGVPIQEGYGLSETSPVACFNTLMLERKPGTVGPAISLCEVRILNDDWAPLPLGERGEIAIRGTNIMKGYYKRPEETAEVLRDGWFRTGDIGVMDEDGRVSVVDRKKEMILRGGFNIYPREIEEVLYGHPDIVEAAVIGVPSETHGEEVMAVVALRSGASMDHEAMETYTREHLAAYKVPRLSAFLDTLPKGPTGKILKREIKARFAQTN
ncbi:MAG: long-chain fatty acid--CoA ligase [Chromatiales bacterium]|nr:long-chain fatty acid--CoA ligase [Chromatiales bacterium]